jgi:hypothetical protein
MITTTVAVEGLNSKTFIRHNLPVCKILGSHSSVVEDSSLLRCDAVSQGKWFLLFRRIIILPSSELFLNWLPMKMKALQSFKMNGTVPPYLL